jgi:hypothetical protein
MTNGTSRKTRKIQAAQRVTCFNLLAIVGNGSFAFFMFIQPD